MTVTEQQRAEQIAVTTEGKQAQVPAVSLELRDVEAGGRFIEGRAVPYSDEQYVGWYYETIAPGCFTKSIKEAARGLPLLLFHNRQDLGSIVGISQEWREQSDGLHGVWKMEDHDDAQRAADMAASGALGYLSVGFVPSKGGSEHRWDDEDELHILRTAARLVETSLVPTPAYNDALVTKVRSAPGRKVTRRPRFDRWQSWLADVR